MPLGPLAGFAAAVPGYGLLFGTRRDLENVSYALARQGDAPPRMIAACRNSIRQAAEPHGVVEIEAVSAGRVQRDRRGLSAAPIEVRIIYARQGGHEVRQSRITCRTDGRGTVVALR
ncbi:hypothetical protein [Salinarimonas soli]|uniref:Uncharacterized protein n=1 Tax=Salinarimonas soli TaxID=1638099 RepID=A0A5B2W112_9HYPH|nr:hypothetical protein [Salinarimonas soli]KAA2244107.1 hypothetical protein F0L46_02385 [Salinarimonas soli]